MKLFKKIDLFFAGDYLCSTNQARTCKEAREKYVSSLINRMPNVSNTEFYIVRNPKQIKARFSK